jgi:dipeptidyl aminopeptidase/acylaminoacyl peptidase
MIRKLICCMALAGAAPVWADAPAAQGPIPLRDFARFADAFDLEISPTGKYVSVKVFSGDQTSLAIMRLSDKKVTAALRFQQDQSVSDYWWVGPERVVASLSSQQGPLQEPLDTGELVGIDADGGGQSYLFGYQESPMIGTHMRTNAGVKGWARMIDPLPKDPRGALVQIDFWADNPASAAENYVVTNKAGYSVAARLDKIDGGTNTLVQSPFRGSSTYLADHAGNVRYVTGVDVKNDVQAWYRVPGEKAWHKLNTDALAKRWIKPLAFSGDDSKVYLDSDEDSDKDCLVEHDLASDQRRKLLCDDRYDLNSVIMSFDGSHPIGAMFDADKPVARFIDPKDPDAQLLTAIMSSFPGQDVRVVSQTQDGGQIVLLVQSDRNPGDYYLFDRKNKNAQYLMPYQSWIDPDTQAEMRPVSFKARDGQQLQAYLTVPPGRDAKKLPLVMLPHGGPFGIRDHWSWQPDPQLLASRGYAVLQINYRGSGGYGNDFLGAGKYAWGTRMIDDITDGVKWAVAQGYADPDRLCIYGASYGGYAALMSAVREPDLYKCAVGYAGVYDLKAMKADSSSSGPRQFIGEMVGDSDEELLAQSPLAHLDKLKAAVMIVHGDADLVVPVSQAKELRSALDARHYPYEWMIKSGEEHGFFQEQNREEFYARLLAFLDRNIGAQAKPAAPVVGTAPPPAAAPAAETAPPAPVGAPK